MKKLKLDKKRTFPAGDMQGSVLSAAQPDPEAPNDTDNQEETEMVELRPESPSNLDPPNLPGPGLPAITPTFDLNSLFKAAAGGDVLSLEGLYDYLDQNTKKLSDSEYQTCGETALMKALLNLRGGTNPTVESLINVSERMGDIEAFVNAAYTNMYNKGQTALHIAIERRSLSYVKLLLSKGADVHAKASGQFFQPHDGQIFYFGECAGLHFSLSPFEFVK
ncbi:transient receptor potential cation channel subfamily V member 4-like [Stigmatopora argus]